MEWWDQSKVLWSTAYAVKGVSEANLAEAHQSFFLKRNKLTDLDLPTACGAEVGQFLKYKEKFELMAQGNYLGRGPSKKILDERQISKQIELIKNTAFNREDLKRNFKSLGLPTPEYLDEEEFLQSSQERNIVRDEYVAD